MPELVDLTRQKPVEVPVDLGDGDTLTLVVDRNKVTPAWVDLMQRRADDDALALSNGLAETIIRWDVTQGGQPLEATGENVGRLSFGAQTELLNHIMRAAVPGVAEGKASSVPSSTEPGDSTSQQPTSQNGQHTSRSPEPSVSPSPT